MQAFRIIKTFDVVGRGADGVFVSLVLFVVNFFDFETFEETFHQCVVVAIAYATHTLSKVMIYHFERRS